MLLRTHRLLRFEMLHKERRDGEHGGPEGDPGGEEANVGADKLIQDTPGAGGFFLGLIQRFDSPGGKILVFLIFNAPEGGEK